MTKTPFPIDMPGCLPSAETLMRINDDLRRENQELRSLMGAYVMDLSSGYDVLASHDLDKIQEFLGSAPHD